ncbi:hypothetical protein HDU79_009167 [Rhizoclosmatium sp. JEL0117]|nr:hypothetical protein HDU79_009167 [Rhizoclosmatium sp. JEL0117]
MTYSVPHQLSLQHIQELLSKHSLSNPYTYLLVFAAVTLLIQTVLFLRSNVTLTHNASTVKIGHTSLADLIRQHCPSLTGRFVPTPWLANGHLQTVFAGAAARVGKREFEYEREILQLPDGGQVGIDYARPNPSTNDTTNKTASPKAIVILLHGLGGGSYDKYILDFIPYALKRGYTVASLNSRGCGGIPVKTPQLYSGSWTHDLHAMVTHIKSTYPHARLFGVGFSLGGNIFTKWVGEQGENCVLDGFVSVANPYDLQLNQTWLHSSFLGKELYSRVMSDGLKVFYDKHKAALEPHAESFIAPIQTAHVLATKYLAEFDDAVTRRMFAFRNVYEYYRVASSSQYVPDIRVPSLFLSDLNDPIVGPPAIPVRDVLANPYIVLACTKRGGHLGWWEGLVQPRRWYPVPILEFVDLICMAKSMKDGGHVEVRRVGRHLHKMHSHYVPRHLRVESGGERSERQEGERLEHQESRKGSPTRGRKPTKVVNHSSTTSQTSPVRQVAGRVVAPKPVRDSSTQDKPTAVARAFKFWDAFMGSKSVEARIVKAFVGTIVVGLLLVLRRNRKGVAKKLV